MGQQLLAGTLKENPSPRSFLARESSAGLLESGRCCAGLFPNFHSAVR